MSGGWLLGLFAGGVRAGASLGAAMGRNVNAAVTDLWASRGSAIARGGVLGPGDPDPLPGVDYLNYRGLTPTRTLRPLEGLPFRLGRVVDPRRGPEFPIGLPLEVLNTHAVIIGPAGSGSNSGRIAPLHKISAGETTGARPRNGASG